MKFQCKKCKRRITEFNSNSDVAKQKLCASCLKGDKRTAGFGPEPITVFGELEKIVNRRYYYCEGCKWHPDVCVHCVRSLED